MVKEIKLEFYCVGISFLFYIFISSGEYFSFLMVKEIIQMKKNYLKIVNIFKQPNISGLIRVKNNSLFDEANSFI